MRVTSDRRHACEEDYLLSPTGEGDLVAVSLRDERPLHEIAAEFDGQQVLTSHIGQQLLPGCRSSCHQASPPGISRMATVAP